MTQTSPEPVEVPLSEFDTVLCETPNCRGEAETTQGTYAGLCSQCISLARRALAREINRKRMARAS